MDNKNSISEFVMMRNYLLSVPRLKLRFIWRGCLLLLEESNELMIHCLVSDHLYTFQKRRGKTRLAFDNTNCARERVATAIGVSGPISAFSKRYEIILHGFPTATFNVWYRCLFPFSVFAD